MTKALVGSAGVAGIELVNQVPPVSNTVEVGKLILQAVVALVTLFKLLKRKKNEEV